MNTEAHIRPDNARKIEVKASKAVFYVYENDKGQAFAKYFIGRRTRPYHYRFTNSAQRDSHVEDKISHLVQAANEKAARRAERNQQHTLKVGDVLVSSWGYDQTNVDFFEVTEVPSKCFVVLREIKTDISSGDGSSMSGQAEPVKGAYTDAKGSRYRVNMINGSPSVKIHSSSHARPWDGKPKYVSWYG